MHDRIRTITHGACQNQVVQNKWSRFVRIQQRCLTKGRLISISFGKFSFHHDIEWPPRPSPHSLRSGGGASVLCSTFLGVGALFLQRTIPSEFRPENAKNRYLIRVNYQGNWKYGGLFFVPFPFPSRVLSPFRPPPDRRPWIWVQYLGKLPGMIRGLFVKKNKMGTLDSSSGLPLTWGGWLALFCLNWNIFFFNTDLTLKRLGGGGGGWISPPPQSFSDVRHR